MMMTPPRYRELVIQARQAYEVPETESIADVVALLDTWTATPMTVGAFEGNLFDEYVDEALVVYQASINDEHLIAAHLTQDERDGFFPDDSDPDEPESTDDDGESDNGWAAVSDELDAAQRVIVILERDQTDSQRVGNYRVHGAGQWVRESLWAATGILPRDPGSTASDLYSQAIELVRPERPDVPVAPFDRLPGWLWSAYVKFKRPQWRRTRTRHLGATSGR